MALIRGRTIIQSQELKDILGQVAVRNDFAKNVYEKTYEILSELFDQVDDYDISDSDSVSEDFRHTLNVILSTPEGERVTTIHICGNGCIDVEYSEDAYKEAADSRSFYASQNEHSVDDVVADILITIGQMDKTFGGFVHVLSKIQDGLPRVVLNGPRMER